MARLAFVASLFMALVSTSLAGVTSYLTLENADASSAAALQKNGLVLDSWSWSGAGAPNTATGQISRPSFTAVTITRKIDGNTPNFLVSLGSGKHYTSFTITVSSQSATGANIFPTVYTFTNVAISALDVSSDGIADDGIEKLEFVYAKVTITFTDPSTKKVTTGSWNIQTNSQARAVSFEA